MGLLIRDDRPMKALTGLSQAQCDPLLPVFRDIAQTTQQHTDAIGGASGTRRRQPGGGSTGQLPPMAEQLQFVLAYSKTSPTCDGLAMPWGMARSKAHENLPKLSPMLYDTLVPLELLPSRALTPPEDGKTAWHGVDRLLIDATARA